MTNLPLTTMGFTTLVSGKPVPLGTAIATYASIGDSTIRPFDHIWIGTASGARIAASGSFVQGTTPGIPIVGEIASCDSTTHCTLLPGSNVPDGTYTSWAHGYSFKDIGFSDGWFETDPDLFWQIQGGTIHMVFTNDTMIGGISFSPRTPAVGQYNRAVVINDSALISIQNASSATQSTTDTSYPGLSADNDVYTDGHPYSYGTNITSFYGVTAPTLPQFTLLVH